jgi:hypothetical protein
MNGINTYLGVRSFGAEQIIGTGRFFPNGASAVSQTTLAGSMKGLFTVTRQGVGNFRVAFALAGFKFPTQPIIVVSPGFLDLASYYEVAVFGADWSNTNRRFDIQTHRAGVAREVAADAANVVHFAILGNARSRVR